MINSSDKILFHVFSRDVSGTNPSKKLRKQGKVVGNIYGLSLDSTSIYMDEKAVRKLYASQGDTGLIYLQIEGTKKQIPVLISEYDTDVFGKEILHVSFKRVNLLDPIKAEISVQILGEVSIPESIVSLVKDYIEVEALPADLPENFEVDISGLTKIGQSVNLSELSFDKSKITLILNEDEKPEDVTLVIVQAIAGEVAEEDTPDTQVGDKPETESIGQEDSAKTENKKEESEKKSE
jgi:large subunit ribosomal protein L25